MTIQGWCDPRFSGVGEEFEGNFVERGEVGASVCITVDGSPVVDLWGGVADPGSGRPWVEDTIATVMSSTKGATALCAHLLIDRGELDLDAPMTRYWPGYGAHGKERTTVRMALSHQAGLPHVRAWIPEGGVADWEAMVALIEAEEPYWEPGTRQGYHGLTFGWLVGELVRRVSGRSLGRFFAEEVAGPLALDFWLGLPETEEQRVAALLPSPPPDPEKPRPGLMQLIMEDPSSVAGNLFLNNGGWILTPDTRLYRAAGVPAAGGVTNARGLAGLYRPLALGGTADGHKLVDEAAVRRMARTESATLVDGTIRFAMRFTLGFHKSIDNRANPMFPTANCILSEEAFGHSGAGGSVGFADPGARMSFGYAMNQMGGEMTDERAQALVDATYRALGYRSKESGSWA